MRLASSARAARPKAMRMEHRMGRVFMEWRRMVQVETAKLFGREGEDRRFFQRFSRSEDDGREVSVVDGVGIVLRLKTDGRVAQMIPRVELDRRLGGSHFHDAT